MLVTLNHEINNPLAIALGRVKLALITKDPKQIQSAHEALVRVAKIVEKMNEIKSGDNSKEVYRMSSIQTSTEDQNESSTMYKVG
jgi:signal transduction histidine kinase